MNIFPSFFFFHCKKMRKKERTWNATDFEFVVFRCWGTNIHISPDYPWIFCLKKWIRYHSREEVCVWESVCVCAGVRLCAVERERERERKCECGVLPPSWLSLAIPMSSKLHTFWSHMDTWMIFLRWWEWRRWREKMWWSRWWWSKPSRWFKVGTIFLSHQWTRRLLSF